MEAINQSGQPRNSGKRGPMQPAPLTSGGLALEEVTCRGWGPHLQYSFLIKLASLSGKCRGPQSSPICHPPTFACDPYNNIPVIRTGRQTESFKTTSARASNRSFPFLIVQRCTLQMKIFIFINYIMDLNYGCQKIAFSLPEV